MRILVCPVATVNAPVKYVLKLLELQNWGRWIDGKVEKVYPEGPMVVGQEAILSAKSFMLTWRVRVKVINIDKVNRKIRYDVFDPFELKNEEELEYKPLTNKTCRVQYNCNFIFPDGIKGFLVKTLLGRKLIDVPEDSIRRLKAEAEREYKNS